MADAMDSKSIVRKDVWVRLPPPVSQSPCIYLQGLFYYKITLVNSSLIVYILLCYKRETRIVQ